MRSFRRIALVLVLATTASVALLILHPAVAAPGDLDPSFGAGGTVETPIGTTASATGVAVQSDGKIVAGGTSSVRSGNNYLSTFALARYLPNGTLDASFGSGGVSTGPCCGAFALTLQPDGRILQAGHSYRENRAAFAIARYLPDGSLDGTFGSGGVTIGPEGGAGDLAVQADGKLVAAGTETDVYAFKLVRFNADGALDPSFGSGGSVRTLLGHRASAAAVVLQPDGKIVAAGHSVPGNPPPPPPPPPAPPPPPPPGPPPDPWQMTIVRYNLDGSLDSSFGTGGVVKTALGYSARITDLALQPDGKLVVTGQTDERIWGPSRPVLARYTAEGVLDPAFGFDGIAIARKEPTIMGAALTLQPDGMIVVAGRHGVARYRPDGRPDSTFGRGGVADAGFPSQVAASDVALQPDGRIVTAGTVGRGVFVLNRFLSRSRTTIAASPRTVRYGRTTVVEGTVTDGEAGIRVQILKHACYEGARVAATTTTGPGGRWRARIRPVSATTYEATVVQEKSVPLTVRVRPRITLSKLGRGLLRARVLARWSMGGETLVLQQFSRKRWVNRRRIVIRRIARRGAHVVSGRTFRATSTNGRRLRLIYPSRAYACYASAVSPSIRG